jgi:hypothetical protein
MESKSEIRDPVHGFVLLNEWERDLIKHPVFQRLRRIRQLAWTDMVYPGDMHSRPDVLPSAGEVIGKRRFSALPRKGKDRCALKREFTIPIAQRCAPVAINLV